MEHNPKNLKLSEANSPTDKSLEIGVLLTVLATLTNAETPSEQDFLDLADWLEENPDEVSHLDQDGISVLITILRNEDPSQLG